jgi:OmpA family
MRLFFFLFILSSSLQAQRPGAFLASRKANWPMPVVQSLYDNRPFEAISFYDELKSSRILKSRYRSFDSEFRADYPVLFSILLYYRDFLTLKSEERQKRFVDIFREYQKLVKSTNGGREWNLVHSKRAAFEQIVVQLEQSCSFGVVFTTVFDTTLLQVWRDRALACEQDEQQNAPVVCAMWSVYFANGSETLTPDSKVILDQIAKELKNMTLIEVKLEGYASAKGGFARNKRLSSNRAFNVDAYLDNVLGEDWAIDITSKYYGKAASSEKDLPSERKVKISVICKAKHAPDKNVVSQP